MALQPVEPQRLYRQIAEQLRAGIARGEFAVGARLPAERDLATQLGVSRPSVREALIALEVEGWVEIRTGSGIYVLDRSARTTPQSAPVQLAATEWGPLELIRARRLVEGEVAALAAKLAKRKDIDAMVKAVQAMEADASNAIMPMDGDRAFHTAIVQACANGVLLETVQTFWDARRGPLFERLGGYFETHKSWLAAIEEHHAIVDAIRQHDSDAARAAMHRHMDKSHARLSVSWRNASKLKKGNL